MSEPQSLEPASSGTLPVAVVVGAVAAALGGAAWAGIVIVTGYEVGFVAWGVGLLVGIVMVAIARTRSTPLGAAAAGMALLGLLIGKLLIIQWGVAPQLARELGAHEEIYRAAVYEQMAAEGAVDEDVQAWYDSEDDGDPSPEVQAKLEAVQSEIDHRVAQLDSDERQRLARRYADMILAEIPLIERLRNTTSLFDLLWVFLAVGTAWKVCAAPGPSE